MAELTERELERQRRSNLNAQRHLAAFANHRQHLTQLLLSESTSAGGSRRARLAGGRLCVLGAGNCHDLDLERLAASYGSIHLVDLDGQALARARDAQSESTRTRLTLHAPIELSGLLERLERWRNLQLTPEELLRHPEQIATQLATQLGGPFEVVASTCLLSQMQLSVRDALSDAHPFFEVAGFTLTLTHLRTLAALTATGGRSVLASDAATEEMAPLAQLQPGSNLRQLLARLVAKGDVFNVLNPELLSRIARDDPRTSRQLSPPALVDVWLWHNGLRRIFLVYALEFERLAENMSS